MITVNQCPRCGASIPLDAPLGQCPACLLNVANNAAPDSLAWDPKNPGQPRRFGDYVLGRQIGSGGMGIVYEAQQLSLNRKVALKLIRDSMVASPTTLRRFTIEAEAVARLTHPHIVPIHEIGECDGQPFFSMDLIEGESLKDKLNRGEFSATGATGDVTPTSWRKRQEAIVQLMVKIARAIHHAHQKGVLHRDLKPANVLVDRNGEPHLIDFGLAKILRQQAGDTAPSLTTSGEIAGTLPFMPPEQAVNQPSTEASDIYGLGALLYTLLTGKPPFRSATPLETIKQVTEQPPSRLRTLNRLVHQDLETICLKCLEKDPHYRYGSAEAFADDLERWLDNRPITAVRAGIGRRTKQWVRRNPAGAALIASLVVGLSIALGLLRVANERDRQKDRMIADLAAQFEKQIRDIWEDPKTPEVTFTYRQLQAFFGESPIDYIPKHDLIFGAVADSEPSADAAGFAQSFRVLEPEMTRELAEPVLFNLRLFKMGTPVDELAMQRRADFLHINALAYAKISRQLPGLHLVAAETNIRSIVIFAHTNSGIERLEQMTGKTFAFSDLESPVTILAKAQLAEAAVFNRDLRYSTNFVSHPPQRQPNGKVLPPIIANRESIASVADQNRAPRFDAGATDSRRFKLTNDRRLKVIAEFPGQPMVYVAGEQIDPLVVKSFRNALFKQGGVAELSEAQLKEAKDILQKAARFDGGDPAGQ